MKNMKFNIAIVLTAIVGSVATFFATNMLMSDISNMFYMTVTKDIISTMPWFIASMQFVLAIFAMIRVEGRPQYKKNRSLLYLNIMIVFAVLGIVMSILTGTIIYHSFTVPYPFRFAGPSIIAWHLFILVASIMQKRKVATWPDDVKIQKLKFGRAFYSAIASLMVFYSLNRLGALMVMSLYVHRGSLHKTWIFYLSLLLPIAVLANAIFDEMGEFKKHARAFVIYNTCLIIANICLIIGVGSAAYDSQFISVISPAVPIERLITIPIDTLLMHGSVLLLSIYCLVKAIILSRYNK